jgi:predicted TIM-barrel enzyme
MPHVPSDENSFPLIGVVHLPPMPGFVGTPGLEDVIDFAIEEVLVLERAGFYGALIENIGDSPSPKLVSEGYVHNMARLIQVVRDITHLKIGVGIGGDPIGSIRAGYAARADFVRVRASAFEAGNADRDRELDVALRQYVRAREVGELPSILLDVAVSLSKEEGQVFGRAGSTLLHGLKPDGLVVSHGVSEIAPSSRQCRIVTPENAVLPIFVGSGFNISTLGRLCGVFSGAFVDTALQINGRFDPELCHRLVSALNALARPSVRGRTGSIAVDAAGGAFGSFAASSE